MRKLKKKKKRTETEWADTAGFIGAVFTVHSEYFKILDASLADFSHFYNIIFKSCQTGFMKTGLPILKNM